MMKSDEEIINSFIIQSFDVNEKLCIFTSDGNGKKVAIKDLEVSRFNKVYTAMKLSPGAKVINVNIDLGTDIVLVSKFGSALRFVSDELSLQGPKSKGVKVIALKDDELVYAGSVCEKYLLTKTNENHIKRFNVDEVVKMSRARKGNLIISKMKSKVLFYENVIQVGVDNFIVVYGNNTDVVKASAVSIIGSSGNGGVFNRNRIEGIAHEIHSVEENYLSVKDDNCEKRRKKEGKLLKNDVKDDIIDKDGVKIIDDINVEVITIDDLLD